MSEPVEQTAGRALTERTFWDSVSGKRLTTDRPDSAPAVSWKSRLKPLFADHAMAMTERVCRRYLPRTTAFKMLEVGCAPGGILERFHALFGYQPAGLDYAPAGVEETRRTFHRCGFDPEQVYEGDLLAPQTAEGHGGRYDVVMSFGLIEHFSDPVSAIRAHLALLRPGGYLIIQIPKLAGFSLLTMWLFRREFIKQHNRSIMRLRQFGGLFEGLGLERLYCGHIGFLKCYGLFTRRERSLRGYAARLCDRLQLISNPLLRLAFAGRNLTWPWSPCLLYIGRRECPSAGHGP